MGRARPSRRFLIAISCLGAGVPAWLAGPGAVAAPAPGGGRGSASTGAVPSPAIAFTNGPGSPFPVGGDPFALVKTATRPQSGSVQLEIPDLVFTNPAGGTVTVLLGDGHGTFALAPGAPPSTRGGQPSAIVASGEGYFKGSLPNRGPTGAISASVLVANSGTNTLSLLFGNGAGGFSLSPGSPFASAGVDPTALAAFADPMDTRRLAVANSGSAGVSVLNASPDGSGYSEVVPGSPFPTGVRAISGMVAGDFNGDGHTDLALVDGSPCASANVAVLLGDGHGAFTPAPGSPFSSGGAGPVAIAADDFNDDGKLDLAIVNRASNGVSILLGNGNGTFALAPGSPFSSGGSGPVGVASWDLNGDGRADLAVINGSSNSLEVFAGNGTGRMTAQPGFPVPTGGTGPAAIVAGDLNGDGLGDLAITNRQSHAVSVFLNTTTAPNYPLVGRTRPHRDGKITLELNAPSAGLFQDALTFRGHRGQLTAYGCGRAHASKPGPVRVDVAPLRPGLRRFHRARTLRLQSTTSFLRDGTVAPISASLGGGSVRHVARRGHRPRRVIVHVASARAAAAATTETPLTTLSKLGCFTFPSL